MTIEELSLSIADGLTTREAAKRFGISQTNVRHQAKKYGLRFIRKTSWKKAKPRFCIGCGAQLGYTAVVYCGNRCQQAAAHITYIDRWLRGEESGNVGGGYALSTHVVRWLRETNPPGCSICGRKKWMGKPIPLEVDHIDGNHMRTCTDNLRLICGNCGMQLPTYKGRNRGNGRHVRRERYKSGQSY